MSLRYEPEIPYIPNLFFAPYMIETAYKYYMTVTKSTYDDIATKSIICALAVEITLKSYNAIITKNEGRIDENYQFDNSLLSTQRRHNLVDLANTIPDEIKTYLLTEADYHILEENKDLFFKSRYIYEHSANAVYYDDIIDLACKLICRTILLYKKHNCIDPFIQHIDTDKLYFSFKERFFHPPV